MIALMLFAGACGKQQDKVDNEKKPLILVSIYPYQLLVKQLVGDGIEVRSLIPPNASPHTWTAQPADLKDLHTADLIISNGMGLELFLNQNLSQISKKHLICADLLRDLVVLDSLKQVALRAMHEQEHEHDAEDEHHHVGSDPHLWTSALMMIKLTTKLKAELVERFPDYAPVINHKANEIAMELAQANEKISRERAGFAKPGLVTYHNSFHYFCDDYVIDYLGWVQTSPGKEPTVKELTDLGKKIQAYEVTTIFVEPQQNPKSAEVLAKEYKLNIKTLDPMGHTLNVNTIAELILANWESMKSGFR